MAHVIREDIEFASADGKSTCRGHIWRNAGRGSRKPRGTVQLVHGMTEHIGRYEELANALAAKNLVVCGIDHLGHGRTTPNPVERGIYDPKLGAEHLIADQRTLHDLMREQHPELSHFMIGHSMGSFVARCCMGRFGDELAGVILLGTGWMSKPTISANRTLLSTAAIARGWEHRSALIDSLGMGGYNRRFADEAAGEPLGTEWVSRDPERVRALAADPDCGFTFSLSGYYVVMALMRESEDEARLALIPKNLPVLIEAGTDDPVGGFGTGPSRLARALEAERLDDVTLNLFDGARHELLNEVNRDEVIGGIASWIDARI